MHPITLEPDGLRLRGGAQDLLALAPGWQAVDDPAGVGLLLRPNLDDPAPFNQVTLGDFIGLRRFTSLQRFSPFWTRPALGRCAADVQPETLWLLAELHSGAYLMLVPLLDGRSRHALCSQGGQLAVSAETGDPGLCNTGSLALFVACGSDPYALVARGAQAMQRHHGAGRLRRDKPVPDFVDCFGWCTWDAFYKDVSPDQVAAGLQSFQDIGVPPRLLILDDGWQQWQRQGGGEDRLMSLDAKPRFGGSLAPLVHQAKAQFGVQRVMVWHALLGYWGGLDGAAFATSGVRTVAKSFGPGLLAQQPTWNVAPWGAQIGVPAAAALPQFYEGWHARLAQQGVDGVKVDAQGLLEGVSAGQGGRVALGLAARQALEASTQQHFDGRLINCMACTQEGAYWAAGSTVLRTSDDFFPDRPASHGPHLHANALASLWFGEFMLPDWDMFQSAHPSGAFHAAARAISGGPVYVSDKVGAHDAALLRKLVLWDGRVLRADGPARPSPDSLFAGPADPASPPPLLKIFNHNRDGAVLGLFHTQHGGPALSTTVGPQDLPGFDASAGWVAWAHQRDALWHGASPAPAPITLAAGDWELVSFAPVAQGLAVIGLADKLNSGGAIVSREWLVGDGMASDGITCDGQAAQCTIALRDGGRLLAWSAQPPLGLDCDGLPTPFVHDAASGRLQADIPAGGPRRVCVRLQAFAAAPPEPSKIPHAA